MFDDNKISNPLDFLAKVGKGVTQGKDGKFTLELPKLEFGSLFQNTNNVDPYGNLSWLTPGGVNPNDPFNMTIPKRVPGALTTPLQPLQPTGLGQVQSDGTGNLIRPISNLPLPDELVSQTRRDPLARYDDEVYDEDPPASVQEARGGNSSFLEFLATNPMRYIGMEEALFKTGQSFALDPNVIENPDARKQARRGNIMRGVGGIGKSLLSAARGIGAGMGFQNRMNDWMEDYTRRRREALVGNYQFKDGGKTGKPGSKLSKKQAKEYWQELDDYAKRVGIDAYKNHYPDSFDWYWENAPNLSSKHRAGSTENKFIPAALSGITDALQIPQSLMVEGVEKLRGNEGSLQNALDLSTRQRQPSDTFLKGTGTVPEFLGDVFLDPLVLGSPSKGLGRKLSQGIKKGLAPMPLHTAKELKFNKAFNSYKRRVKSEEGKNRFINEYINTKQGNISDHVPINISGKNVIPPKKAKRIDEAKLEKDAKKSYKEYVKRLDKTRVSENYRKFGEFRPKEGFFPDDVVVGSGVNKNQNQVVRHELEHLFQNQLHRNTNDYMETSIDESLKGIELKPFVDKLYEREYHSLNSMLDGFGDNVGTHKSYFVNGNRKTSEKSTMLAELQQILVDNNHIKHQYDNITPEIIDRAYRDPNIKTRILAISDNTENNRKLISDNLNKMLTPTAIGIGLSQQEFQNGGILDMLSDKNTISRIQFFRNGGTSVLPIEKALTGAYITGLPKHAEEKANAEVERGEYIQHPNGDIQKVLGKTHPQGGEKVNLEANTEVTSDHLKGGRDIVKEIQANFDLKISPKDTYAKIIDKYTKKIGLQELNDDQEALYKKLKEQEDVKDETTANLNRDYLSGEIKEIEDKKKELEEDQMVFADYIFKLQEASKTLNEKNEDDLPILKKGGKMDESKVKRLPSYQDGDTTNPGGFSLVSNAFNTDALSPRERQAFNSFLPGLVAGNIKDQAELNARIVELIRLNPTVAGQLFSQNSAGDFTLDSTKVKSFQENFNRNAEAIGSFIQSSDAFSDEEKQAIISSIQNEVFVRGDKGTPSARNIDSIFANFTSSRPGFRFDTVTPDDRKKLAAQGITSFRQLFSDGKLRSDIDLSPESQKAMKRFEDFEGDFLLGDINIPAPAETPGEPPAEPPVEVVAAKEPVDPLAGIKGIDTNIVRQRAGFSFLPPDNQLPPEAIIPHTKITRSFDRLTPTEITNEENLKELARNQAFTVSQIEGLPDSQNKAALANALATTQEQANKSVTEVNRINALNRQTVDQFNIQQSNMEENARAQDLLNFEERSLTAQAKTMADYFNYFEKINTNRAKERQFQSQLNTLRDMFQNFNPDASGNINLDPTQFSQFFVNMLGNTE